MTTAPDLKPTSGVAAVSISLLKTHRWPARIRRSSPRLSRSTGSGGEIAELRIKSQSRGPAADESIQNIPPKPARSRKAPTSQLPLSKSARIHSAQHRYTRPPKSIAAIAHKSGIYRIVCKVTGHFYVGSAVDLHERSRRHCSSLRRRKALAGSHMSAVARRRIASHRGWPHREGRKPRTPKQHNSFIRPDGRPTVIINLSRYCWENGLSVVRMHNLKSGIRRIHKGWTWSQE